MRLRGNLGALAGRSFRLVFSSTSISAFGDGVTTIALAFGSFAVELVCFTAILAQPSVWAIRNREVRWDAGAEAAA